MSAEQNMDYVVSKRTRIIMFAQAVLVIALLPPTLELIAFFARRAGFSTGLPSAQAVTLVAILCIILLLKSGVSMRDIGIKKLPLNFKNISYILGGTLVILLIDLVIKYGLAPVFGFEFEDFTSAYISFFEGNLATYIPYMIFVVFLSAGIGEEILTRGFLFNRFETAFSGGAAPWMFALFLQAVAFGCFHYDKGLQTILVSIISGLILGVIYLLTDRNLIASISTHILVNSIYITSYFLGKGVFT